MKRLAILAVAVATVALALDLESVQRSSARNRYLGMADDPLREMNKRRYPNVFDGRHDLNQGRMSEAQYYRRMQELLANMVAASEDGRNAMGADPSAWPEVLRQRDARLTQMADIRPPYDQDDFPPFRKANEQPQESMGRWSLPPPPSAGAVSPPGRQASPVDKRLGLSDRQGVYRSHKQLPYSMRVPQEEVMRKRAGVAAKPKSLKTDVLIKDLKKPAMDKRNKRTAVATPTDAAAQANASKATPANASSAGSKMSPSDFKQWLTDEYYRNMAMSFATMRKRRSVPDQGTVVYEGSQPEVAPEREENAAFDHLRLMEQSLLQEAVQLMQNGSPQGGRGKQLKTQVSQRLDVAHDIENLNKALQKLYADSQRLRTLDEAQLMADLRERAPPSPESRDSGVAPLGGLNPVFAEECPELTVLSSGCAALQGMFPPPPVHEQFLLSCNWHEVCYACGAQHGMSSDQCDQQFLSDMRAVCARLGSCNKQMVALLIEPLHKKRVFYKRSSLPVCERPCVASFLGRN